MTTHSIDLSMDLATLSTLTTDTGVSVESTLWDAPLGGHHVEGKLIFPATKDDKPILEGATKLTLTIINLDAPTVVLRFELARGNEHLNHQFEYNRSRMRISRASALNFGLATVMGIIYILMSIQTSSPNAKWFLFSTALIIGVALTLGAAFTWRKLMWGYFGMLKEYSRFIKPTDVKPIPALNNKNQISTLKKRGKKGEQ